MADIPSWLRGFRARTPGLQTPAADKGSFEDLIVPHCDGDADTMAKSRDSSRVSSFLGFVRQSSALSFSASESFASTNSNIQVKDPGQTWHNPNPYQVAENLKVVMMTQSSFDPVPVKHNTSILQVLEAYQDMCEELKSKDKKIERLKSDHSLEISALKSKILEWEQRERDYKTEMKKLEVMLATGERGLELVTMARTSSVLNRRKDRYSSKKVVSYDPTSIPTRTPEDITRSSMSVDFASSMDRQMSMRLEGRGTTIEETRNVDELVGEAQQPEVSVSEPSFNEQNQSPAALKVRIFQDTVSAYANEQHQAFESGSSMSSGSSSSGLQMYDPHYAAHGREYTPLESFSYQGKSGSSIKFLDSKPLPHIPQAELDEVLESSLNVAVTRAKQFTPFDLGNEHNTYSTSSVHRRGFSFVPGDDLYELALNQITPSEATRHALQLFQSEPAIPNLSISTPLIKASPPKKNRMEKDPQGDNRHLKQDRSTFPDSIKSPTIIQLGERAVVLSRESSIASIVTAIRDNSGRSSKASDPQENRKGIRPKLDRDFNSNEAIIAATRAIAANEKKDQVKIKVTKGFTHSSPSDRTTSVKERAEQINVGMRKSSNS